MNVLSRYKHHKSKKIEIVRNVSHAHADVSRYYLGSSPKICMRCTELNLLQTIENPWDPSVNRHMLREGSSVAKIQKGDMDANCSVCEQFFGQMAEIISTARGSTHIEAKVYYVQEFLQGEEARWTYIMLRDPGSGRRRYLLPEQIEFIKKDGGSKKTRALGRILPRHIFGETRLQEWFSNCQNQHPKCREATPRMEVSMRLIDCERERIVTVIDQDYACLSYVWGHTKSSHSFFKTRLPRNLPRTVSDAMIVTRMLGLRYLWVDRICINQEDQAMKHYTIANMGSIYTNALVTIIAAAGDDAEYGLPGISRSRIVPRGFDIGNTRFAPVDPPLYHINASKWNFRGWTFQESLLSHRRLVFTDSQVYFQCGVSHNLESIVGGHPRLDQDLTIHLRALPDTGIGELPRGIFQRLQDYLPRQLSYPEDTIDAFAGVLQISRMQPGMKATHFYGVPIFYHEHRLSGHESAQTMIDGSFAVNLSFNIQLQYQYLRERSSVVFLESEFPSWSWAFWKARPQLSYLDFKRVENWHGDLASTSSSYNPSIRIEVMHRDGGRIPLITYVKNQCVYTDFQPFVDITGWVIGGHFTSVRREGEDVIKFSALPRLRVDSLRLSAEHIQAVMSAICVGTYKGQTYHLLVTLVEAKQYRCVGVGHCWGTCNTYDDLHLQSERQGHWQRETIRLI
ncbi:hypothetical protein ACN47E_007276 [Coniothyrium glycines]